MPWELQCLYDTVMSLCALWGPHCWLPCSFKVPLWDRGTINSCKAEAQEQLGLLTMGSMDLCCAIHEFLLRDSPLHISPARFVLLSALIQCGATPHGTQCMCALSLMSLKRCSGVQLVPCGCYQPVPARPEEQMQKWGLIKSPWCSPQIKWRFCYAW